VKFNFIIHHQREEDEQSTMQNIHETTKNVNGLTFRNRMNFTRVEHSLPKSA